MPARKPAAPGARPAKAAVVPAASAPAPAPAPAPPPAPAPHADARPVQRPGAAPPAADDGSGLSAEVRKLRARFLSAVEHLGPEAGRDALRTQLAGEQREMHRIGNLAAQSWLVRQRFGAIMAGAGHETVAELMQADPQVIDRGAAAGGPIRPGEGAAAAPRGKAGAAPEVGPDAGRDGVAPAARTWQRVRIVQETEVNGVRFFAGTNVDVSPQDAARLVAAQSAELVTEPAAGGAPPQAAATTTTAAPAPSKPAGGRAKKPAKPKT
jgi:hypothetical protein